MSARILWDAVPSHVRAALQARERAPREGETAIVDAARGERWYFRRTKYGWLHLSTDRQSSNDSVASDLTPEQRAEALRQVELVERRMRETLSRGARQDPTPRVDDHVTDLDHARELARRIVSEVATRVVHRIVVDVLQQMYHVNGLMTVGFGHDRNRNASQAAALQHNSVGNVVQFFVPAGLMCAIDVHEVYWTPNFVSVTGRRRPW